MTKDLLFGMALCHETKTKGEREMIGLKLNHIHLEKETADILEFAQSHSINFECACTIAE